MKPKVNVRIPRGYKPKQKEIDAAWILAQKHKTTVEMLRPSMRYKVKTPDFRINDLVYELKTPETSKGNKVLSDIMKASKQASNVIIDMRRTKIIEKRMVALCRQALKTMKRLQSITLIVNKKKVL